MNKPQNPHAIIAHLVETYAADNEEARAALHEARTWLDAHASNDPRVLAQETLESLDALLRVLQGGTAVDALLQAREALKRYINRVPAESDRLQVKFAPSGGVILQRNAQHMTIQDDELEQVRDAVNTRKRELRKRQRRESNQR